MKLKDFLITEARIYQNNFIKVDLVKQELKKIFNNNAPKLEFDNDGMFICIDNIQYDKIENNILNTFKLIEAGYKNSDDESKNIKKYYIEYYKLNN